MVENEPKLLLIETATTVASVALSEGPRLLASTTLHLEKAHARALAPMIQALLAQADWAVSRLSGVAVSAGPGSFTGLRVGVSTAKGIAYAADLPLIAVGSLDGLAGTVLPLAHTLRANIVSLLDARRMEVYLARFDAQGNCLNPVEAVIVGGDTFPAWLSEGPHLFVGDGVEKCLPFLRLSPNAIPMPEQLSEAGGLLPFALRAFLEGQFADLVAFEPDYLKPVRVTQSKKGLIG